MSKGNLTFIGLGLFDEKDISLKGLEEIKNCNNVFAEFYTSKLFGTSINKIEKLIKKKIVVLNRDETEKGDKIFQSAKFSNTCFLVPGDSMNSTTHIDLRLRAIKMGIKTKIIHGSSIISAVSGLLGLQNYKFGRTTTISYPEKNYFPTSPIEIVNKNKKLGLHTLILLDIQADKEKYMTANEGLYLLLKMVKKTKKKIITKENIVCVVARAGSDKPLTIAGKIKDLINKDFGPPLHSIVIPGKLHFMEIESLHLLAQLPTQYILN